MRARVVLMGGAGNQLFQLCAALTARESGWNVTLDGSSFNHDSKRVLEVQEVAKILDLDISMTNYRWRKALRTRRAREITVVSDPPGEFGEVAVILQEHYGRDLEFRGYFQSAINVRQHTTSLLEAMHAAYKLPSERIDEVAVHVRRGDYVSESTTQQFHGTLGISYYSDALRRIQVTSGITTARIYSDDIDFVVKNTIPELDAKLPGWTFLPRLSIRESTIAEICDLSRFSAHVIANSTFSWWAAHLADTQTVVGPLGWFADEDALSAAALQVREWTWI